MAKQVRYICSKCDKDWTALEGSSTELLGLCAQCYTLKVTKDYYVEGSPQERAQVAYEAFSSFANSDKMNSDLVGEAMIHDHPLLQAYTLGIMLDCIKAMAENDHVTPQNEAAVKLCKEITEFVGEYPQYL